MNRLTTALRFLVIGPEFLVLFLGGVLAFGYPHAVNTWLPSQALSQEVLKYVAVLPLASSAWMLSQGRKLLFPEKDKSHALQEWPDYWRLKYGFNIAIFYSFVFSLLAIFSWAMDWQAQSPHPQVMLSVALLGAVSNFLTFYYAQIELDEAIGRLKATSSRD